MEEHAVYVYAADFVLCGQTEAEVKGREQFYRLAAQRIVGNLGSKSPDANEPSKSVLASGERPLAVLNTHTHTPTHRPADEDVLPGVLRLLPHTRHCFTPQLLKRF